MLHRKTLLTIAEQSDCEATYAHFICSCSSQNWIKDLLAIII